MNASAANIVATGLLKGAFDVLDAMLSTSLDYTLGTPEAFDEPKAVECLSKFPVILQGRIRNNLGTVALLLSVGDAARFAALIQEQDFVDRGSLTDDERAMLQEIADPALGGGVTNLMEQFGRNVEQLDEVLIFDSGAERSASLAELIGPGGGVVPFTYQDNAGLSGSGMALHSESLEALVPPNLLRATPAAELGVQAELSPDEMNDILSGFGGAPNASAPAPPSVSPAAAAFMSQGNLDMVLDIGLIATARLGHVEMPIGDILKLGPGSIIEVGHMVDEPVDLLVNGKLIARGDVVVVDEKFGLRITEIISPRERIESLR
jgi:flagellar motor switch protein FliN/FliY